MNSSPLIKFVKPDLVARFGEVAVAHDDVLMNALLSKGLPVASSCGGDGVCTKCRLRVHPLEAGATSDPSDFEKGLLRKIKADPEERISCQTKVRGPIEVDADYW